MEEDPWCQVTKVKEQYRRLKEEHQRLQMDYSNLEGEYKQVLDALTSAQADCAKDIENLQSKNRDLERELFLLRPHIITPESEELIKIRAIETIEKQYVEEFRHHSAQIDNLTSERNELRRENDFLKAELSSMAEAVDRAKLEYKQRLESETKALQNQRDALLTEERTRISDCMKRSNQLDLENKQLSLRLNGLLKENEELTMSYQKLQAESNNAGRDLAKKVAALNAQLSALVAERDCGRQQNDMLSRELAALSEANVRLTSRVHDLERQNGHFQAVIDEMVHNHTMELNNTKLQFLNEKSTIERERTDIRMHLKECEAERENLRLNLEQKAAALIDKERECQQKIAMAQEEALKEKTALEDKISELGAKLAECERRSRMLEDKLAAIKEQASARADHLLKERDGLNLEIVALKEEIARHRNRPEPAPVVIHDNAGHSYAGNSNTAVSYPPAYVEKLEKKVQTLKEKLRSAKKAVDDFKTSVDDEIEARRRLEEKNTKLRSWIEEFCRGHSRYSKLLESAEESWNKENGADCGPCGPNKSEVLDMVRFLNEKVADIEVRTARQLSYGHNPSPSHSRPVSRTAVPNNHK